MSGHHKMVEDADIDQRQRLHQRARQQQVGFAGLRRAGRMVMGQHDAGGIARQRFLHHLARIDAGMGLSTLSAKRVFPREQGSFGNSCSGKRISESRDGYTWKTNRT